MQRQLWWLSAVVVLLLGAMALTDKLSAPPALRAANEAGQFDAGRAKARLARILGDEQPHPADTVASDGVRDRLLGQLVTMGLSPRIDDRFACNGMRTSRGVSCARVSNIVVTLGPERGWHLLINSHYDSSVAGPGASDAGLGVATMLEVAALMKDRPLARPVTFLFNEGEELGLIGARAFLDDPLAAEVDSLINLEARGVTGPVNMFETSEPNGAAIAVFADAVERPVANSLSVSAYRQLPNATDVNVFADRGWLTLNLAPVGNETRYHSPGDDLAALDLRTLQHMGDQTLALTRRLAAGPAPVAGSERLFMDVAGRHLVTMPMMTGAAGLVTLVLLFAVAAWRRGALLHGVPAVLGAIGGATALGWLGLTLVGALRPGHFWRGHPSWTEMALYAGAIGVALILLAAIRRLDTGQWRAAYWLGFTALGGALAFFAPGAIIYFLIPPAIAALGMAAGKWNARAERVAALVAAIALWITLGSVLGLLEELLNGGPLWLFALVGSLILLPFLIEARPLLGNLPRKRVVLGGLVLWLVAWVPTLFIPAYSADRQQQFSLQYVVDPAARQPMWSIINDGRSLPAAFDRFGRWDYGTLPLGTRQRWLAPAPPQAGFAPPAAVLLSRSTGPQGRSLRFRLEPNGADSIALMVRPPQRLRAAGLPDRLYPLRQDGEGPFTLNCTGRSCNGAVVELVAGNEPVEIMIVGTHWRLPPAADSLLAVKPADAWPQYQPNATILIGRLKA